MTWFYVEKGQKLGPVTEEELKMRIEARTLDAKTLVWHEKAPDWKPLSTYPELLALLPATTDAPPVVAGKTGITDFIRQSPSLTIDQLRDPNETTALTVLYIFAVPALLLLAAWGVASLGVGFFLMGLIWLARFLGELFSAAYIKTNSIRVSEVQLPDAFRAVTQCSQRLGITPPDVYVMQHNVWNAFASKMAGQRMVVLYSGAIDSILLKGDLNQLTWLVGHEIGHHFAGHLNFSHTLAKFGGWAPWFLLWYQRRAEFTCDRIALYCVANRQASLLALANATAGAQLADRVNIGAAIEDWEKFRTEFFVKYRTIYSTHPPHLWRMQQLCDAAAEFGIN